MCFVYECVWVFDECVCVGLSRSSGAHAPLGLSGCGSWGRFVNFGYGFNSISECWWFSLVGGVGGNLLLLVWVDGSMRVVDMRLMVLVFENYDLEESFIGKFSIVLIKMLSFVYNIKLELS